MLNVKIPPIEHRCKAPGPTIQIESTHQKTFVLLPKLQAFVRVIRNFIRRNANGTGYCELLFRTRDCRRLYLDPFDRLRIAGTRPLIGCLEPCVIVGGGTMVSTAHRNGGEDDAADED